MRSTCDASFCLMHLHKVCVLNLNDPFTIICMQQRHMQHHTLSEIALPQAAKTWSPVPVLSQDSSVREFLDGTFAVKSGQESEGTGHHTSSTTGQSNRASDQAQNPFKTGGSNNAAGQNSTAFGQGGSPFKVGGSDSATNQNSTAFGQGGSPFKAGGADSASGHNSRPSDQAGPFKGAGSGSSGSTVTTGVPAFSPKQGALQSTCCCSVCCFLEMWSTLQHTQFMPINPAIFVL